jgi:Domain of unknown function (DUF4234)
MTDTASRPDMQPAVATLTPPDATTATPIGDAATPTPTNWAWPLSVPHGSGGAVADGTDEPVHELDAAIAPPHVVSMDADPLEVTVVAAITTPERGLLKVTSFGHPGKRRSTAAIVALSIVTLGIYSLIWYHRVNREVGNFDTRMHVVPGRSTAAVTIPWALGWLVSIVGAVRIVLAVLNVALPFDPHFTVLEAYGLLFGCVAIPYLELLLPFSAVASVMTLERVRIVEDRMGRTTDVQLRPTRVIFWMLVPVVGGLMLMAITQRRLNRAWEDDMAAAPAVRPTVRVAPS